MAGSESLESLCKTLKTVVAALRDAGVRFALGGSVAAWARGGPEPQSDLDVMVKPEDAQAALQALTEAGMRPERPPEEWLYKAFDGDVMVDIIFGPSGLEITDEVIERADTLQVMAISTPVMAIEDVLVTRLCSLDEHSLDYGQILAIARSLREQIDWQSVQARTERSPYAKAFFTLVEALAIAPAQRPAQSRSSRRVRVIDEVR